MKGLPAVRQGEIFVENGLSENSVGKMVMVPLEEYLDILKKWEIEYDEKYVFEWYD